MKPTSVLGVFAAASFAFLTSPASAAWYITDLNLPSFSTSTAADINNSGQIVGSFNQFNTPSAFLYDNGTVSLFDTSNSRGGAAGINNSGQIIGGTDGTSYIYSNGSFTTLPGFNYVNGINDRGQVVGSNNSGPYLYQNGSIQNIAISGWRGAASGINDNGVVVGYSEAQGGGTSSFTYSNGQLTDIGKLGGSADTYASAINNAGQIVGYAFVNSGSTQSDQHAFLYSNGQFTDLGLGFSEGSSAKDINNRGQIIGTNGAPGDQVTSWLYSAGKFIDLGALPEVLAAGWKDLQVMAINDNGDIVGQGITSTGWHGFVLSQDHQFAAPTLAGVSFAAPEIDGGSAMLGVALLGGMLAFVRPKKSESA